MTLKSLQRSLNRATLRGAFAVCLLGVGGAAMAAGGNVSSIRVTPTAVTVNELVSLKVGITGGSSGVSCNLSWAVLDASSNTAKGGTHGMQSDANSTDFTVQFGIANPGVYTVQVTGGAPTSQLTVCQGTVKTTLTVKAKASAMPLQRASSKS